MQDVLLRLRTALRPARQTALVVAMIAALLGLTVLVGHSFAGQGPYLRFANLPWWALGIGFAATEASVFYLQTKREARTVSISELPLVLGLFLASPAQLLLGRLAGSVAIFLIHRRAPGLKTAWNLALVSLQTAVAVALFHLVAGSRELSNPLVWLGAYAGAIAANCVASIALALVITIYERDLRLRPIVEDMVTGEPFAPFVVTLGLIAVVSLSATQHSAWLLLVTGTGLLLAYRAYASLADRHLGTERLYRFAQAVTSAPEVDETLRKLLKEAKELLRAERAEVAFVASDGGEVAHVRLGATGRLGRSSEAPADTEQWLLSRVVGDGDPLLISRGTRDPAERRWLDAQVAREAIAVPLRGGTGILGVLTVTDRIGDVRTFAQDDVRLLETVASHASVALQNGKLMDQLRHEAIHDALTGLP